jgi:hypothetical protein
MGSRARARSPPAQAHWGLHATETCTYSHAYPFVAEQGFLCDDAVASSSADQVVFWFGGSGEAEEGAVKAWKNNF